MSWDEETAREIARDLACLKSRLVPHPLGVYMELSTDSPCESLWESSGRTIQVMSAGGGSVMGEPS